uniref:L-xylulose reductase n=1 Tax=Fusarium oxysporum (strain Fo5176) TaxID=660025 RepID=A0A0D2XN54_FUSOF
MSDLNPLNGGNFVHDNKRVVDGGSILKRFSLQGKTAIITGAAAGIGLSIAEAYAEVGANIAIWYRTSSKAEERAEEISKKYNVSVKAYQVDMRDAEAVEKAIDQSVKDLNAKHWRRQKVEGTDINGQPLTNYTSGSFIATASMSGSIVNTPQLQAAYNAAKAGVIHLIKSLAVEWARYARANAISPGYIITEISNFVPQETKDIWKDKIPLGREGEPHELQGAYLFLASDASTYATGANFVIDGGYSAP